MDGSSIYLRGKRSDEICEGGVVKPRPIALAPSRHEDPLGTHANIPAPAGAIARPVVAPDAHRSSTRSEIANGGAVDLARTAGCIARCVDICAVDAHGHIN